MLFSGSEPAKLPLLVGGMELCLIYDSLDLKYSTPRRFNGVYRAHQCEQHRQTDAYQATPSVAIVSIYVMHANDVVRPKTAINIG